MTGTQGESLYDRLSRIGPPDQAGTYRGWATWYDWGHFQHGICYRETKWRARSPAGELVGHPDRVGDLPWLKAEIDKREAAASRRAPTT